MRWQYSLGTLFLLMTLVATVTTTLIQGNAWYLLAAAVIGQALILCVIAGMGSIEEQNCFSDRQSESKETTE